MRIHNPLVTGGAGFIGSHLVEELIKSGLEKISVLDNFSEGDSHNLACVIEKVKIHDKDITTENWLDFLSSSDFDAIFHFAGNANIQSSVQKPDLDYQLNLQSTFYLLEAIRKLQWPGCLIFASSAAVYGNPLKLPISEIDPTLPISPYGVSKLAAERYISIYCQLYNIRAVCLRSASVFGPRLKKQVVYDTFQKILRNPNDVVVFGDGLQTRDFIFVKDAVRAALVIAKNGELNGEVYNVASGRSYSILDLTRIISQELGVDPVFNFTGDVRAGEPEKWEFDIQKIAKIGFKPVFSLQEGISETKDWILSESAE